MSKFDPRDRLTQIYPSTQALALSSGRACQPLGRQLVINPGANEREASSNKKEHKHASTARMATMSQRLPGDAYKTYH
jgi:hypothetical protein